MRIPYVMLPVFETLSPILNDFCQAFLDERYEPKCQDALERLCCMRPSPLLSGNPTFWAAGICYFICSENDRFARGCKKHISTDAVAGFFEIKPRAASMKASQIRKFFQAQSQDEQSGDCSDPLPDPWRVEP